MNEGDPFIRPEHSGDLSRKDAMRFSEELEMAQEIVNEERKKVWSKCRQFYKGDHKPSDWDGENEEWISINLVESSVVSEMPRLTFQEPHFNIRSKKTFGLESNELLFRMLQANLAQSVINHFVQQGEFYEHQQLGILDAKLSYGLWKVFLNIEREDNPRAGEFKLDDDGNIITSADDEPVPEPDEIPVAQTFSIRRVRPEFFLVDPRAGNRLASAEWVAEKIPMPTHRAQKEFGDDVEADGRFEPNTDDDKRDQPLHKRLGRDRETSEEGLDETIVYEVWDLNKERMFYVVNQKVKNVKDVPPEYKRFDGTPYVALKFQEIPNRFYPMPDVWSQLPLNLSYDLARTNLSLYRRHMIPKFLALKSAFEDSDELEKLKSQRLGEIIYADGIQDLQSALQPIPLPRIPDAVFQSMNTDLQDFRRVSGITASMMGQSQSETATAEMTVNNIARNKSEWKRKKVERAMEKIGKKLLKLIQTRMTKGGVVRIAGPAGRFWVDFEPEDIEGEFELSVQAGSTQHLDRATERQQFLEAMQMASSMPGMLQQFNLPRVAEKFVELIPGLDNSVLLGSRLPTGEEVNTLDQLVERLQQNPEMQREGMNPPIQAPEEGGGANQTRNIAGTGGQAGQNAGSQGTRERLQQFGQAIGEQAQSGTQNGRGQGGYG